MLLRFLLQDDEEQLKKATSMGAGSNKVLVVDVVLSEAIWTLKIMLGIKRTDSDRHQ